MSAWRPSTTKQYAPYIRKWEAHCDQRRIDPIHPTVPDVLNFLTELKLYATGIGYSAINTAKPALSALIMPPSGQPLGAPPVTGSFHEGHFHTKAFTAPVWHHLGRVYGPRMAPEFTPSFYSHKQLALKVATLLRFLTGQRLQTLIAIELQHMDLRQCSGVIYIQKGAEN